jgi:hypothetical protein
VHLWLHYQSETELYAVSVNRRGGSIVINKKCPGGPSNGGTYVDLAKPLANQPIPFGVCQKVTASIRDNADGSVTIALSRNGTGADKRDRPGHRLLTDRRAGRRRRPRRQRRLQRRQLHGHYRLVAARSQLVLAQTAMTGV